MAGARRRRHCLYPAIPLPSWLRHCLCLAWPHRRVCATIQAAQRVSCWMGQVSAWEAWFADPQLLSSCPFNLEGPRSPCRPFRWTRL